MNKYLKTKEGSLEDLAKQMQNKVLESDYQDKFKKELDKAGKPIGQMTGAEKKAFFNKIDKMHSAKNESLDNKDEPAVKKIITKLKGASQAHADQAKGLEKAMKTEKVDNPYAVGMAAAMKAKDDKPPLKKSTITKAHDIAKSIEKDQKEDYTKKDVDKFHTKLDKLVHKSFGHSSDEKKEKKEEVHPHVKKMVKDGESDEKIKKMHPKTTDKDLEKLKETHMSTAKAQNQKQKEVGGEKEPIKTPKNEWKTFAMMAAELREKKEEKEDKKEMQAGDDTRDKSKKTMTGQVATSPEMNPKVDYKY
jgi:hypothetical protein